MKFSNYSNKSIMLDQHKTLSVMLLWAGREVKVTSSAIIWTVLEMTVLV